MINSSEILQTVQMFNQQHLDIRTITMGISLLDCADPNPQAACQKIYDKICRRAEHLVATGAAIEKEFAGRGYGEFKLAVAEVVKDAFAPIQAEYKRILADKAYLDGVLTGGARRAAAIADRTVTKVYKKVGFLQI